MKLRKIGTFIILACILLALMPAPVAAANSDNSDILLPGDPGFIDLQMEASTTKGIVQSIWDLPSDIIGKLAQEKPQILWSPEQFFEAGDQAQGTRNYQTAINNYNAAEAMYAKQKATKTDPRALQESELRRYQNLAHCESSKASAYESQGNEKASLAAKAKAGKYSEKAAVINSNLGKTQTSTSPCLIVTATFGSPLSDEVQLVRNFRDQSIAKSYAGSRFMPGFNAWYYSFSPQVSDYINDNPVVKPGMRILLTPLMEIVLMSQVCYSFLNFNPEIATFTALVVGGALYGLVYVFPFVFVGIVVAKRRGWKGADAISMKPVILVWAVIAALLMTGVVFSIDLLTTVSSGLLVIFTIILVAGAPSLNLSHYIYRKTSLKTG
jgi:hypothetical protein